MKSATSLNKPKQDIWKSISRYSASEYVAEPKLDGERCTIQNINGKIELVRDGGKVKNANYPELLDVSLPEGTVLDGEICIPKNDFYADFVSFQSRMNLLDPTKIRQYLTNPSLAPKYTVSFVAFDILQHKFESVTDKEWTTRRSLLESTVKPTDRLKMIKCFQPDELLSQVKKHNMEGIILKPRNSTYSSKNWIKMKNMIEKDFRVTGYNTSDKRLISTICIEDFDGNDMGNVTYFGPNFPQTKEAAKNLKGKIAVVQYLGSGSKDKPRHPVLKELR